jgi:DNA-binding NarL/FixJ family response regulator
MTVTPVATVQGALETHPGGGAMLAGPAPLRVVVADPYAAFREGVRLALEGEGFTVAAEASNADDAVMVAARERPDLCLIDVHLRGNGIAAARRIGEAVPETAVVMLSSSDDSANLIAALRAGAVGFLPKTIAPDRLPRALRGVSNGEAALPRHLTTRLIDELNNRAARRRDLPLVKHRRVILTDREWDVADLLCDELSTAEIASQLGLADVTVRRHISQIMRKLGASNRRAALAVLTADRARV